MVDHHLVANGNCHQTKGKRPKSIGSQFPSLSMTSQLMKLLIPVIAIWLLMAIPSKKGLAAQFHWFKRSTLVNINGGHLEGYIRNASYGSVPKIANLSHFFLLLFLIHLDNHLINKGSLLHSLAGWYVFNY